MSNRRNTVWALPQSTRVATGVKIIAVGLQRDAHRIHLLYKTPSAHVAMVMDLFCLDRAKLPLVSEAQRQGACGDCKGRNGGCPGSKLMAPRLENYVPSKTHALVVALHFDMAWAIRLATPRELPGQARRRPFAQLRYADRLTESLMCRFMRGVGESKGWPRLGLGNCRGCASPSDCNVMRGGPCAHPGRRTFSVEAVGIDVDTLHYRLYGESLPWYYKDTLALPTYMTRYGIFLAGKPFSNSFTSMELLLMADKAVSGIGHLAFPAVTPPVYRSGIVQRGDTRTACYIDPPVEPYVTGFVPTARRRIIIRKR